MATEGEKVTEERAKEFARKNKELIARGMTAPRSFLPDEFPVAVFMASSPGAGKTESSKIL